MAHTPTVSRSDTELVEKGADSDLVRELLAFAADRMMELEVEARTGAPAGTRSPNRFTHRNGYRERAWETGRTHRGARIIAATGCGSCRVIPGIEGANGPVGPPLTQIGRRVFLAGLLRNTPDNMVYWLRRPQEVVPGNAMPDTGLSEEDAPRVAAYLATLD